MHPSACPIPMLALAAALAACSGPASKPSPGDSAAAASVDEAPAAAAPASSIPRDLRVVGTEPFWGIRVEGERLHFTTVEDQAGKSLVVASVAEGVRYAGRSADGTAFELRLHRATCSDGMSERTYAYTAAFRYGTTDYAGCADDAAILETQPRP